MIKKIIILASLLLTGLTTWAQQDAMYTQYMFNYLAINPGYAGSRGVLSVTGLYRKQWVNVDGSPATLTFTADAPISRDRMGVGITVSDDKLGIEHNTSLYGTFAYRLRLSSKGTLSFGANAGFTQYRANLSDVNPQRPDPNVFAGSISQMNPNIGFGIFYSTDKFYLSASLPHILTSKLSDLQGSNSFSRNHFFLGAGYVFTINPSVKLKPSVLVKGVEGAPLQADINANIWLIDKVGFGMLYRTGDSFAFLAEFQATTSLRFGYAFDLTTTRLGNYSSGTHELMVRYEFATNKRKMLTPRYF
jgi:type IX secretion system PorP/SprF family membrane protein